MGLGALRTSLEIKHPDVTARMQTIFFIGGMMVVLATADINIRFTFIRGSSTLWQCKTG
jgi:hypothetical protein